MFDRAALDLAERVSRDAIADIRADGRGAVVVSSVAGAGKSHLVARAAGALAEDGVTVLVTAPTNEQAYGLVDRISELFPDQPVAFCPAHGRSLSAPVLGRPNVRQVDGKEADHHPLLVATMDKVRAMRQHGQIASRDRLLLDEAYQADSGRYFAVAGLAERHLVVGDSGQLDPFSSAPEAERWRGLPEDPIQSAVSVLLRNHPDTIHHRLPVSRRLDPRGAGVAGAFYPGFSLESAVRDGVRRLELSPGMASEPAARALDRALDHAAQEGWAHVELPAGPALVGDPLMAETIVGLLRRLRGRGPRVRCEYETDLKDLRQERIAVGVSHREQRRTTRTLLDDAGLHDVVCDTANRLQGLQFDVVVVWHPLAGLPETDAFHLDPGRLAVLLTRHRHACIVVGRHGDAQLVAGIPPSTPAYLGVAGDQVLDGFEVHAEVFARLDPTRVEMRPGSPTLSLPTR